MAGIVARLEASTQEPAWCRTTAADLRQRAPLALATTLRHIREAAALDLRLTLMMDYRLACRLAAAPDFAEGVRALLIDKTRDAKWRPSRIEDVTTGQIDRCFAHMPGAELVLPTRQEMQAARV